jgi:hypothetical protein
VLVALQEQAICEFVANLFINNMTAKLDFGTVFGKSIFQPYSLFGDLAKSDKNYYFGWMYCLGFSFMYSLTALLLYLRGWQPVVTPTLTLPVEKYYLYQTFFTIPVSIFALGLGTVLAYWFSHLFGSETKLIEFWGPVCVASVIPSLFTMWIPETFFIPFLEPPKPLQPPYDLIRIITGSVWTFILIIIAVKHISGMNWFHSVTTGIITAGCIGSIMAYFFR